MPSGKDRLVIDNLGLFVVYGVLLGVGTLLVGYGIRDFLLFLEGYTFDTRGYGPDIIRIVVVSSVGWFLMLSGLMKASRLTLNSSCD